MKALNLRYLDEVEVGNNEFLHMAIARKAKEVKPNLNGNITFNWRPIEKATRFQVMNVILSLFLGDSPVSNRFHVLGLGITPELELFVDMVSNHAARRARLEHEVLDL